MIGRDAGPSGLEDGVASVPGVETPGYSNAAPSERDLFQLSTPMPHRLEGRTLQPLINSVESKEIRPGQDLRRLPEPQQQGQAGCPRACLGAARPARAQGVAGRVGAAPRTPLAG